MMFGPFAFLPELPSGMSNRRFDAPISFSVDQENQSPLERAKAKLDAQTREAGKAGPPKCAGFLRDAKSEPCGCKA